MRRIIVVIGIAAFLAACGGTRARVSAPGASSTPVATAPSPGSTPAPAAPAENSAPRASSAPAAPARAPSPTPVAVSIDASELVGMASYYAEPYHGRRTASGEIFDSYQELTAAHRTLPFNTIVRVTNTSNGRDVEVRINDRGPFTKGRVIDLSLKAAREIDLVRSGVAPVRLTVLKLGSTVSRDDSRVAAARSPSQPALFAVQVGAFEVQESAESLRRNLERRYRDVSVEPFTGNRTLYRVRVGRAADRAAAENLADKLRGEDFEPFVVQLN